MENRGRVFLLILDLLELMNKIIFLISGNKRSLLLKSINKIATLMIKKEQLNELDRKKQSKPLLHCKYAEQQTGSDTPKKSSFKLRFIQWLKQLPLDERYLAVKVNAPGLSKRVQECLIQLQNEQTDQSKKDSSVSKKPSLRQAKQIIDSIVLISDGQEFFDSIGFDFSYVEHPDKFYQLLAITLNPQEKQMFQTEQYHVETLELKDVLAMVNKSQSREELAQVLGTFFRGEIFLKFEEKRAINLEEEKMKKKEFSVFWRNLSEENKKKMLMLNKEDFGGLSSFLGEKKIYLSPNDLEREVTQLLQMEKNEFCNKIFKCKLRKSLTYYTDYHELVYRLWKGELNKRKRRQRNNKAVGNQKAVNSTNSRGSILQIGEKPLKRGNMKVERQQEKEKVESQVQKEKSKQNLLLGDKNEKGARVGSIINSEKQKQKQKGNKTVFSSHNNTQAISNTTLLTVPQANEGQGNSTSKKRKNRNRRKKSVSAQSKQTNATNHRFQKQERKIQEETCSTTSQHNLVDTLSQSLLNSESTLQSSLGSVPNESSQLVFPQINYEQQIHSKLQSDIQQYSDLINEEANQFYQRRVIAYERIQFMLGMWKIPIKLFGSCASGITIKNSDIDIAVDNSILNYFIHMPENTRLKGALQQLQQLFQQQPWVTGLKLIKTAAIPLIKMKVNTSINFTPMPGTQLYQSYIDTLNRQHLSSGQIHIDLTIQTINKQLQCNHLGIISTDHINNWLKTIKSLHPIVIVIKNYLTKTNLNITYEGGLNTYSMICMLVAFLKENHLEDQTKVVTVLEKILKFYAFQFDQKMTGIDLLNPQNIFYNKLKLTSTQSQTSEDQPKTPTLLQTKSATEFCQADLLIKDPLNNGKNMTKNCYSFPKIRQIFHQIHKACFQDQTKKLEEIFKQDFKQKFGSISIKQNFKENSKEVRELLDSCKLKLGNPFLTLFE